MGTVEERYGLNEAIFRALNERIAEMGERFESVELEIVCECIDIECVGRITVRASEYADARSDERTFIVLPDHVAQEIEDVVLEGDGYRLVRKRGDAGDVAAELGD